MLTQHARESLQVTPGTFPDFFAWDLGTRLGVCVWGGIVVTYKLCIDSNLLSIEHNELTLTFKNSGGLKSVQDLKSGFKFLDTSHHNISQAFLSSYAHFKLSNIGADEGLETRLATL